MKIKNQLKRQLKNFNLTLLVLMVLFVIVVGIAPPELLKKYELVTYVIFGIVIFGYLIFYWKDVRCPGCNIHLTKFGAPKNLNFCPTCGRDLDEHL